MPRRGQALPTKATKVFGVFLKGKQRITKHMGMDPMAYMASKE